MKRLLLSIVASVALLAGCTGDSDGNGATGDQAPSPSPSAQSPGDTEPASPTTTSGELGSDNVPSPTALGEEWQPEEDPGDGHEELQGNGSYVRERVPEDVVRSLVPLGCPGVSDVASVPRPEHALEATYRGPQGAPAVALVLDYPAGQQARRAIRRIAEMRATCDRPPKGSAMVIEMRRVTDQVIWDVRRSPGSGTDPWLEVALRSDTRVSLIAKSHAGKATDQAFRELQAALREQT